MPSFTDHITDTGYGHDGRCPAPDVALVPGSFFSPFVFLALAANGPIVVVVSPRLLRWR